MYELTPEQEVALHEYEYGGGYHDEEELSESDDWLISGWLSSHATMVTGVSEAGKTTLVASLAAAVANSTDWAGESIQSERTGPVLVVATDPGDDSVWKRRGQELGVRPQGWYVTRFQPGCWDSVLALADTLNARMLILDNITGALDRNINDADPRLILNPLDRALSLGVPVVAVHHTAEGSTRPMGPQAYKAWRRFGLHVTVSGGKRKVTRDGGNQGVFPPANPDGSLWLTKKETTDPKKETTEGAKDENGRLSAIIESECEGWSKKAVAQKLVELGEYGSVGSAQTALGPSRSLGRLMEKKGWKWDK